MTRQEEALARCAEASACLERAARDGSLEAIGAALETRESAIAALRASAAGALDPALVARLRAGEAAVRDALLAQCDSVRTELADLRAARAALARRRVREPRLLSRRV
jgi:hypothetical protein